MMNVQEFGRQMMEKGWVVFDSAVSPELVARMNRDIEKAYEVCRAVQQKNGIADNNEYTIHHLIGLGESFMEFIEALPIVPHLEEYFQGKFILNSFGGAINSANSVSYAHRVHRDIRTFSGPLPLLLNTLVMLDEFTAENGATLLMPGSHRKAEKPTDEEFFSKAEQAVGRVGSILVFNSNVWHCAGTNRTQKVRRSVTPMYCKPSMKQQFDYPRAVGYSRFESLSEQARQILGFYSRVPASLDEWYQPPERRMYRPDQG